VDPPTDGALTAAGIGIDGGEDVALDITLLRDRHADVVLDSVARSTGDVRLELPQLDGPVGLRFEAVCRVASAVGGNVTIERPRVVGARATAEQPPLPGRSTSTRSDAARNPPNVVVYLVDALRADHLGCYRPDRTASPRIDEFAADATVFEDAVAQSSWTKAAVASIFTGLWPPAHSVHGPHDRLPEDVPTMPELLRDAGYRTAAVVANAYVGRSFGFDRGFEHFEFLQHTVGDSSAIHARIVDWLDRSAAADPFFLYVHTVDPHAPYDPPSEFRHRFADEVDEPAVGGVATVRSLARGELEATASMADELRALYEAEVAFSDFNFGRLVAELKERDRFANSVIIFVSDHGEAFGEHGTWTHGLDLHDESLRIPLIVRFPSGLHRGRRIRHTVQQADLLPTVLAAAGVAVPEQIDGVDLAAFVAQPSDRTLFCYLDYWERRGAAVLLGEWKLIRPLSEDFGSGAQLYNRSSDPGERHNLAAHFPTRAGFLETLLRKNLARLRTSVEVEVDGRTRAELEALGYIE
jgi:arylsulfatase A-like enzyme